MHVRLVVEVELERESGLFASKDDIVEKLKEEIQDPGSVESDDGATYNVTNFDVDYLPDDHVAPHIRDDAVRLINYLRERKLNLRFVDRLARNLGV